MKRAATTVVGQIAWDGQEVLEREVDVDLARQTTVSLITSLEVFGRSNPNDRTYAALLAKAYGQYAYGFYEEDLLRYRGVDAGRYEKSLARADRFFLRGRDYGLHALDGDRSFRRARAGSISDFERSLGSFKKRDVPLLFWTAFSWAGWLNLNRDDPAALAQLPRVVAMIERVLDLDPGYAFGSARSFLGVIDASRPPMLGGRPEEAKRSFEAALEVEPRYLMTKVLYAQYYAVQVQDRRLFERLLGEVLATDAEAFPEQRLANELAKRRAEILLAKKDRWF